MGDLKTDNGYLEEKLELRRYFLRRYPEESLRVMDCCNGSGVIWSELRKEFELAGYFPIDVKPKPGRLKLDSSRVLGQPGWTENVIDIDTYGSPWTHWEAMLPNIVRPVTVFLTIGQLTTGTVGRLSNVVLQSMGLGPLRDKLAPAFHVKLAERGRQYCLARLYDYPLECVECQEVVVSGNAQYLGIRLNRV